jgi:hypothetical protein
VHKVALVCPIAEVIPPKTFQSALAAVGYAASKGIQFVDIGITERQLIDGARNVLAEAFLTTPTEWIFWMDADMVLPKDTITELFKVVEEKNAKIVPGIYYQRRGMNLPVLWSRNETTKDGHITGCGTEKAKSNKYAGAFMFPHKDKKTPFKVHASGFGCVLVHRSVFEALEKPWFKFIDKTCSEDFYFFVNAQEKGFEVWAQPTIKLGHIGDAPVVTVDDFWKNASNTNLEIDEVIKEKV